MRVARSEITLTASILAFNWLQMDFLTRSSPRVGFSGSFGSSPID